MVLPVALLTIGAVLLISGFTGRSLSDVINGENKERDDSAEKLPSYSSDDSAINAVKGDLTNLPRAVLKTKTVMIDGHPVAGWIAEIVMWAKLNGGTTWNGQVTSGVRSDSEQRAACEHVCGNPNGCPGTCAEPGKSNHRGTIFPLGAVDVTNPEGFAEVLKGYPGGAPIKNDLPNDRVHFSRSGH